MLASFLLALREGLEAALIIGIVLGALRKMGRTELAPAVWRGALSAAVVSVIGGVALTAFGMGLEGPAEPVFEGVAMLLAAGVLTWMIFWMSRHALQHEGRPGNRRPQGGDGHRRDGPVRAGFRCRGA